MSPQELVALLRRHVVLALSLFVFFAGLAYHIERTKPLYMSTATVAFVAPGLRNSLGFSDSLLAMDEVMAYSMMSPRTQELVRAAGGTASYNVALVNLNNEDFPDYGNPYVTVTTTSRNPVAAQSTFTVVMRTLRSSLAAQQARQGSPPRAWIQAHTIAPSGGPIAQSGYPKRTLAGLAVLAITVTFMALIFLDRRPYRVRLPRRVAIRRQAAMPRPGVD